MGIKPELVEAASAVASSLPFNEKTTVSQLLQILKRHNDLINERQNTQAADIRCICLLLFLVLYCYLRLVSTVKDQGRKNADQYILFHNSYVNIASLEFFTEANIVKS